MTCCMPTTRSATCARGSSARARCSRRSPPPCSSCAAAGGGAPSSPRLRRRRPPCAARAARASCRKGDKSEKSRSFPRGKDRLFSVPLFRRSGCNPPCGCCLGRGCGGIAERDRADAAQRLRQTPGTQQRLAVRTVEDLALAVDPHGAEPLGVRGQHEVFEHAAAVGHVVCAPAVAEHDHNHRRTVVGVGVLADHGGVELRQPRTRLGRDRGDDHRRLRAHGGRGIRSGLEHTRKHVRRHGVRLVGADAAPGHYECQKIVCHTMTSVRICYGQYITNRARVVYCWQISGFSAGLAERSAHMIFHITRLILWLLPSAVGVHGIRASACRRKRLCCALCVLFLLAACFAFRCAPG